MKRILLLALIICGFQIGFSQTYDREWATYFGDSSLIIQGTTEFRGNLYLVGKTTNSTHTQSLTNNLSYQSNYGGGEQDGFIAKFSLDGQLIWFTYYGGQGSDEITNIVADESTIYIVGQTTSDDMATENAFQTLLNGSSDGFIASFNQEGNLNWHTYFGGEGIDKVINLAQDTNTLYFYGQTTSHNDIASTGAFQQNIEAGSNSGEYKNSFIASFTKTGQRIWATYYGIAQSPPFGQGRTPITGIAVNETGLYVSGWDTISPDVPNVTYFGTPGSFLETKPVNAAGLAMSLYLSKFSFEGTRSWSTYLSAYSSAGTPSSILPGINDGGVVGSRSITANANGVYITGRTPGVNGISTEGTFQPIKVGLSNFFINNFSDTGERLWGSYLGNGIGGSGADFTCLNYDSAGNIYISGTTKLIVDIPTADGYQTQKSALGDLYVAKISADGATKLYATYYGGANAETDGYVVPRGNGDSFFLVGTTASTVGMTTTGAWQEDIIDNGNQIKNIILAKFTIAELLNLNEKEKNGVALYPNPTNGLLNIVYENDIANIDIYSIDGKKIKLSIQYGLQQAQLDASALANGIYILVLTDKDNKVQKQKFVKE